MFYENQPIEQRENYKNMLKIVGGLSNLFSESDKPYLHYRCHENIFCRYFSAINLSREDCSADAQKNNYGIGLKTWVGADNQKVAEFNKLKDTYMNLEPYDMICKIAEYRNERIRITKNLHGIKDLIYHIVKRIPNAMQIYECAFEMIDVSNITLEDRKSSRTNIYFNDRKHEYHFNISKSTLYMIFENMELLDSFDVDIIQNPYEYFENMVNLDIGSIKNYSVKENQLCLRLYTVDRVTKEKTVAEHSGLNQWNGARKNTKTGVSTPRDPNEIYIPYPAIDRARSEGFFPPQNENFNLILPDGNVIKAKVCQDGGKAIMSNPNSDLGKWLLRDVFELPEGKLVTYEMLKVFGIDSVIFTKINKENYGIDFTNIGTYERLLGIEDETEDD